jgi:hypothetical protein
MDAFKGESAFTKLDERYRGCLSRTSKRGTRSSA